MLRANAPVFTPGATRFPLAQSAPVAPKRPDALADTLQTLRALPASARAAAIGPLLDALSSEAEQRLQEAVTAAVEQGDTDPALTDLNSALSARTDALKNSAATHGELVAALCRAFPKQAEADLALAALLLPAELHAKVIKSHASLSRAWVAMDSPQATTETIARLAQEKGDDGEGALAAHVEETLGNLPRWTEKHSDAMSFLEAQAAHQAAASTPLSAAPRAVLEASDDLSIEAIDRLRTQNEALCAFCRAESGRLEGTQARAFLDHAIEQLGRRLLAYRNLENYCTALGLNRPAHLPAQLIAASKLSGNERKKKMRELVRSFDKESLAALTKQLLDRNHKPSPVFKDLLAKLRSAHTESEKLLATVFDSLQQQLATLARAPRKDARSEEDALLEEAIEAARREKARKADAAEAKPAADSLKRQELLERLRAQRSGARDANNQSFIRAEAIARQQMEEASITRSQSRYGESLAAAIESLRRSNVDMDSPGALEAHIAELNEFEIVRLLADAEKLAIAVAEGVVQKIFPAGVEAESQNTHRIFSAAKRMAQIAQGKVTIGQAREWLDETLLLQNRNPRQRSVEGVDDVELVNTLLTCVPMGGLWARTIDKHRSEPPKNPVGPIEQHVDWGTALECYNIVQAEMRSVKDLGEDLFFAWMFTNRLYLAAIGESGDATLTPGNARLLERISYEQADALANRLGDRLRLLANMEVNASMTYAITMCRVKAQSESMTSPAAFSAWCLMDALFQAEWDAKTQKAQIRDFRPQPDENLGQTVLEAIARQGAGLQLDTVSGILTAFSNGPRQNHGARLQDLT
jgi:hypothetical protein